MQFLGQFGVVTFMACEAGTVVPKQGIFPDSCTTCLERVLPTFCHARSIRLRSLSNTCRVWNALLWLAKQAHATRSSGKACSPCTLQRTNQQVTSDTTDTHRAQEPRLWRGKISNRNTLTQKCVRYNMSRAKHCRAARIRRGHAQRRGQRGPYEMSSSRPSIATRA